MLTLRIGCQKSINFANRLNVRLNHFRNCLLYTSIGNCFGVDYGYSDHTKGIEVPIAAVALGAKVIEKHFTLDRNWKGPDHIASLEPDELKRMVDNIRRCV